MTCPAGSRHLVVGTAGHVDHGKSRLVWALTGTDPDRLPEEKARGMTIDLGFAHARIGDCQISFVDVPGHVRFIRNMVAGAVGVDLALLVIAADDSVMPQTREHAELLALLGVRRCIVTLTKMDLVDEDWAAQVEDDARRLVTETGLAAVGLVRTSSQTGRGLETLREVLAECARGRGAPHREAAWFHMPIDRAFHLPGRGTVVTGTVSHGVVRRGDELELRPAGRRVRVREMQAHHEVCEVASGRMRLAFNLAGVSVEQAGRGCELATPGYLEPAQRFDVALTALRVPSGRHPERLAVRMHVGTTEVQARLRCASPADTGAGSPGAAAPTGPHSNATGMDAAPWFAQLRTARPLSAAWGQRFVLRDASGNRTLGGGLILRTGARGWTRRRSARIESLEHLLRGGPDERLEEVIRGREWNAGSNERLAAEAGLEDAAAAGVLCGALAEAGRIHFLQGVSSAAPVHAELIRQTSAFLDRRLRSQRNAHPRWPGVPRSEWPAWMPRACPARLRAGLADRLIHDGRVLLLHDYVLPLEESDTRLAPQDRHLLDAILAEYDAAGFQPPAVEALACRTSGNAARVGELVQLAAARGELVRLAPGLWLSREQWERGKRLVTEAIRARGGLTVAEIRDLLGSSRKWVVPIVEALDASGVTRRAGDVRRLATPG
jgi:selenocysteine-specific elongation factor